eukprot:7204731-Pyramimonas_sp.AAC.1
MFASEVSRIGWSERLCATLGKCVYLKPSRGDDGSGHTARLPCLKRCYSLSGSKRYTKWYSKWYSMRYTKRYEQAVRASGIASGMSKWYEQVV